MTESEGGSYSEQAVSSLQPSIFLGSSSLYYLGDVDAVVAGDMLVADPSSNAEAKPWLKETQPLNVCLQSQRVSLYNHADFTSTVTNVALINLNASWGHH